MLYICYKGGVNLTLKSIIFLILVIYGGIGLFVKRKRRIRKKLAIAILLRKWCVFCCFLHEKSDRHFCLPLYSRPSDLGIYHT